MTEVSAEAKEFIYLLTLQFSKFRSILHMQFIICMQLGEKIKSAKKKPPTIILERFSICSSSMSDLLPPNGKNIYLYEYIS